MKRHWVFAVLIFCAGWSSSRLPWNGVLPAWAGGGASVAGDVNRDGAVNLSDPIHLLSFLFQGGPPPAACDAPPGPVTVAFLVRHAEKAAAPADDPCLTPEGALRAERLAEVFKNARVDRLIASEKCRTRETLAPLAAQQGIATMDLIGDEERVAGSVAGVSQAVRAATPGTVLVVAHHSTTIRPLLKEWGVPAADADSVNTGVHDNLLVVLLPAGGSPQLLKLRY
jgi:phosphohistidine phosphatase SixA